MLWDDQQTDSARIQVYSIINIDGILPVLPYDFAIVPDDSVVLKASTIVVIQRRSTPIRLILAFKLTYLLRTNGI